MNKKISKIKRFLSLALIFLFSINTFATSVNNNDGSAFITKAEFDALKSSFQAQIDTYNKGIDSKIDNAIVSYLSGISIRNDENLRNLSKNLTNYYFRPLNEYYKTSPKDTASTSVKIRAGASLYYGDRGGDPQFGDSYMEELDWTKITKNYYFLVNDEKINGHWAIYDNQYSLQMQQYCWYSYGTTGNYSAKQHLTNCNMWQPESDASSGLHFAMCKETHSGNMDSASCLTKWVWSADSSLSTKYLNDGTKMSSKANYYIGTIKSKNQYLAQFIYKTGNWGWRMGSGVLDSTSLKYYEEKPYEVNYVTEWSGLTTTLLDSAYSGSTLASGMPLYTMGERDGKVTFAFKMDCTGGDLTYAYCSFIDDLNNYDSFPPSMTTPDVVIDDSCKTDCVYDSGYNSYKVTLGKDIKLKINTKKSKTIFVMCCDMNAVTKDRKPVRFLIKGDIVAVYD